MIIVIRKKGIKKNKLEIFYSENNNKQIKQLNKAKEGNELKREIKK
jgi:hypothetical protein